MLQSKKKGSEIMIPRITAMSVKPHKKYLTHSLRAISLVMRATFPKLRIRM